MENRQPEVADEQERRQNDAVPLAPDSPKTADAPSRPGGEGTGSADQAAVNQERAFETGEENPV